MRANATNRDFVLLLTVQSFCIMAFCIMAKPMACLLETTMTAENLGAVSFNQKPADVLVQQQFRGIGLLDIK